MSNSIDKAQAATTDSVRDSRDQLIEDFKRAIEDAQNLAEEAKNASGTAINDKIEEVQKDLKKRMKSFRKFEDKVIDEVEEQSDNLEDLISQHPWRAVAIAAAVGLLADRLFFK